jgi:hypothetical protein
MIKRTLTVGLIGAGLVAIVSAQQPAPAPKGQAAFKPLPASTLGTLRQPVKDIPKPTGKWRTPWGDPDLQGIWNNGTSTPLQRDPRFGDREYLTDQELAEAKAQAASRLVPESVEETRAAQAEGGIGTGTAFWFEISDPNGRTSLIYDPPDGRLPQTVAQYQAQQKERARLFREPRLDKSMWERQGSWVRCITRGQPAAMNPVVYNNNYQIIKTPGYVVILQEMVHVSRIIPLDGRPHVDPAIRMWEGDARGRWEGETLVVETTNFHPESEPMDRQPHVSGQDYKVIQRFTRITDTEMDYRYTLDAPTVFTRPYSAAIPMTSRAAPERMQEYACVEGDNAVRLTVNGLVRTFTDPEYAKRWRAEIAADEAAAAARGGRRGGGPAGAPPAGAAPAGRGAGPAGQ